MILSWWALYEFMKTFLAVFGLVTLTLVSAISIYGFVVQRATTRKR